MGVVVQHVSRALVTIDGHCKSAIRKGMMILTGTGDTDGQKDTNWLYKKVVDLRVFDGENGAMNKPVLDAGDDILIISQFTLRASTEEGNRLPYIKAAKPETSVPLYEQFYRDLNCALGKEVGTGKFGANMKVELLSDGPVTICIDTGNKG